MTNLVMHFENQAFCLSCGYRRLFTAALAKIVLQNMPLSAVFLLLRKAVAAPELKIEYRTRRLRGKRICPDCGREI